MNGSRLLRRTVGGKEESLIGCGAASPSFSLGGVGAVRQGPGQQAGASEPVAIALPPVRHGRRNTVIRIRSPGRWLHVGDAGESVRVRIDP